MSNYVTLVLRMDALPGFAQHLGLGMAKGSLMTMMATSEKSYGVEVLPILSPISIQDIPQLKQLIQFCFSEEAQAVGIGFDAPWTISDLSLKSQLQKSVAWGLKVDEEWVGAAWIQEKDAYRRLHCMALDLSIQKQGWGDMLLQCLNVNTDRSKPIRVTLTGESLAQKFFESRGFLCEQKELLRPGCVLLHYVRPVL
jgi:hypothetical protein